MKHLLLMGVAIFYSVSVMAAMAPERQRLRTQVTTVDTNNIQVEIAVPNEIDYSEELKKQDLGNIRKYKGMEDAKYARKLVKKLRDNPEDVMWHTYHVSPGDLPQRDLSNKNALGSDKAPMGIVMKDTIPEDTHWVDSLNDVRLPDFVGDYDDLRQMQEEFKAEQEEAKKEIYKVKIPKHMKLLNAPIVPKVQ